jgi:hypothetical protein
MKGAVKEGDYPYTMKAGVIYIHLNINNKYFNVLTLI